MRCNLHYQQNKLENHETTLLIHIVYQQRKCVLVYKQVATPFQKPIQLIFLKPILGITENAEFRGSQGKKCFQNNSSEALKWFSLYFRSLFGLFGAALVETISISVLMIKGILVVSKVLGEFLRFSSDIVRYSDSFGGEIEHKAFSYFHQKILGHIFLQIKRTELQLYFSFEQLYQSPRVPLRISHDQYFSWLLLNIL